MKRFNTIERTNVFTTGTGQKPNTSDRCKSLVLLSRFKNTNSLKPVTKPVTHLTEYLLLLSSDDCYLSVRSRRTADPTIFKMSNKNDPEIDFARADIGMVCALGIESAAFLNRCLRVRKYKGDPFVFKGGLYDEIRIVIAHSGVGFARARKVTQALLDAHNPNFVLSIGFSGGLKPELKKGDIIVANAIGDEHGNELPVDTKMPSQPEKGLHVGKLLVADKILTSSQSKLEKGKKYKSLAVDLESLAVAQVCKEINKPFMAVRVISDEMSEELPDDVLSVIGASGSVRLGALAGSLWKRPKSYKDLWKLRQNANKAASNLASFLDGVVRQLYDSIQT